MQNFLLTKNLRDLHKTSLAHLYAVALVPAHCKNMWKGATTAAVKFQCQALGSLNWARAIPEQRL